MNAYFRTRLICEVFTKAMSQTESFRDADHIGADLAYLFAAIADLSEGSHVLWDIAPGGMHVTVHRLFSDWFPPEHDVWKFIRLDTLTPQPE